ncbi:hypothetical protein EGI22_24050 [Lacihabitans sp. LS3-19]|uniref:molybdopterin dinucleotide binding domain-containing protein n=1 Tax=Lacihabitans sp. LS3-19 TaxID=2487335 RepID=UPI0020CBE43E|nr:molybdopterin dinucleotide binding domain-containing protein [Lacihabitans sp. LS3-19]MCP9770990.1 hypothetical protein [Lacihabitans sp. LS3-19]
MAKYPQDVTYNPERILKPLKRVGEKGKGQFEEISWDKAISEISTKLQDIIANEGGKAILPFSYGGNESNVQTNAGNRNIQDGDSIKVFNQRGEVLITARIQNKVKQGVVCMPQGYWSSLIPGGSTANALTSDLLTDMGGSAALQECQVEIMKAKLK